MNYLNFKLSKESFEIKNCIALVKPYIEKTRLSNNFLLKFELKTSNNEDI